MRPLNSVGEKMEELIDSLTILTDPSILMSQIWSGISLSSFIVLVSLGVNLIFGVSRVLNLAQGSFYLLGAYIMYSFLGYSNSLLWYATGLVVVFLSSMVIGGLCEVLVMRRIYKKGTTTQLVTTFGMMLVLDVSVRLIWGASFKQVIKPEGLGTSFDVMDSPIPIYSVATLVIVLVLLAILVSVLKWSRWGLNLKAASTDLEMLDALGTDANKLMTQVFSVSAGLAGLAGALAAPMLSVGLDMGRNVLTSSLVVIVIGGMGSLMGSAIGCLIVGQLLSFGALVVPSFSTALTYLVMILVLCFRPWGLFGRSEGRVEDVGVGQ